MAEEEKVLPELIALFDHMFSREVIENDSVMQSCMSSAMTIPLSVILESPRVQSVTANQDLIRQALDSSKSVNVFGEHVRPNYKIEQNTIIIRDLDEGTTEESLRAVFLEHGCPAIVSCRCEMNSTWFLSFESENDARSSLLNIRNAKINGQPVRARLKTESMSKSYFNPSSLRRSPPTGPHQSAPVPNPPPMPQSPNGSHMRHHPGYPMMNHAGNVVYMPQSGMQVQGPGGVMYYVGPDGLMWPLHPPPPPYQQGRRNMQQGQSNGGHRAGGKKGKSVNASGESNDRKSRSPRHDDSGNRSQSDQKNGGFHEPNDKNNVQSSERSPRRNGKKGKKKDKEQHHGADKQGAERLDNSSTEGKRNKAGSKMQRNLPEFNMDADFPSLLNGHSCSPSNIATKGQSVSAGSAGMSWANAIRSQKSFPVDILEEDHEREQQSGDEAAPDEECIANNKDKGTTLPSALEVESDKRAVTFVPDVVDNEAKTSSAANRPPTPKSPEKSNDTFSDPPQDNNGNSFAKAPVTTELTTNQNPAESVSDATDDGAGQKPTGKPTFLDIARRGGM